MLIINQETFFTLKEIHSLDLTIKKHLDRISQEKERIRLLNHQRQQKSEEQNLLKNELTLGKKELQQGEKELNDLNHRLDKAKLRYPQLKTSQEVQSTQREIDQLSGEVEEKEIKVFEQLELVEKHENRLKEIEQFLQGSLLTVEEISNDVEQTTQQEEQEINNLNKRMEALLETLPPPTRSLFLALNEKYRYKNPITQLQGNHTCGGCHMSLSKQDALNVDKMQTIETCSNCGRILISSYLK